LSVPKKVMHMRFGLIIAVAGIGLEGAIASGDDFYTDQLARPATETEVRNLFKVATKEAPNRVAFLAMQKVAGPPKTQAQLQADAEADLNMTVDSHSWTNERKAKARASALADLKKRHSGTNYFKLREWKSGDLFRVDQLQDTQMGRVSTSTNFEFTRCYGIDADGERLSWGTLYGIRSTTFDKRPKSRYQPSGLLEAYSMDPAAYFFVFAALAEGASLQKADRYSTHLITIDEQKLRSVLLGTNRIAQIVVTAGHFNGENVNKVSLLLQVPFVPSTNDATLYFIVDASNYNRIYRTYLANRSINSAIQSDRSDFDSNDFPRRWVKTQFQPDGTTLVRDCQFLDVEMSPTFSDTDIFSIPMLTNYIVTDTSTDGEGKIVRHPGKYTLAKAILPAQSTKRLLKPLVLISIIVLNCCFLGIMLRKCLRRKA
jgi:hypothetical protein